MDDLGGSRQPGLSIVHADAVSCGSADSGVGLERQTSLKRTPTDPEQEKAEFRHGCLV